MTKVTRYDASHYLDSEEMIAAYVAESLASDDPSEIAQSLGAIARAHGMTRIAKDAGLSRENLYKALCADGNPELATLLRVMKALGLKLSAVPARKADAADKNRSAPRRRRIAKATETA